MRKFITGITLAAAASGAMIAMAAPASGAGLIERACVGSSRQGTSRALCGCIQDVADLTLSGKDQRLAASLFRDPPKAQEIRQSNRRSHEMFWKRYKNFGATAEAYCAK